MHHRRKKIKNKKRRSLINIIDRQKKTNQKFKVNLDVYKNQLFREKFEFTISNFKLYYNLLDIEFNSSPMPEYSTKIVQLSVPLQKKKIQQILFEAKIKLRTKNTKKYKKKFQYWQMKTNVLRKHSRMRYILLQRLHQF